MLLAALTVRLAPLSSICIQQKHSNGKYLDNLIGHPDHSGFLPGQRGLLASNITLKARNMVGILAAISSQQIRTLLICRNIHNLGRTKRLLLLNPELSGVERECLHEI